MVKLPTIEDLAKANVHFGHKVSKRHPKIQPYLYGVKNTVHIFNLEKTLEKLKISLDFIVSLSERGKVIAFVGTKPSAKRVIKNYAEKIKMPYITERWIGGTLTNFSVISHLINKYKKMLQDKESGEWEKYTKKEKLELERELNRKEKMVGGIKDLSRLPDALYIVDLKEEETAVKEARRMKIPIVAMVDTNNNPELADYPIPANDDATKSIELITGLIIEAIEEGRKKQITNNKQLITK